VFYFFRLGPLACFPFIINLEICMYRIDSPVGLLGRGISPVASPLPTQENTNTEETRTDTHASSGINSTLRPFYLLRKSSPPPFLSTHYIEGSCGILVTTDCLCSISVIIRRSQWLRGLRHEPFAPVRTLGSWVRIPLEAWMSVCVYSVFVLFCV
jgi:hypothetical protein